MSSATLPDAKLLPRSLPDAKRHVQRTEGLNDASLSDAEDLMLRALVRAPDRARQPQPDMSTPGWLSSIAHFTRINATTKAGARIANGVEQSFSQALHSLAAM